MWGEKQLINQQLSQLAYFQMMVPTMSDYVGLTLKEAGLDKIKGGHLVQIIRIDHEVITAVPNDEFIFGGDRLIFL